VPTLPRPRRLVIELKRVLMLRAMGYRKLSARPRHHAQAQGMCGWIKRAIMSVDPPGGYGTTILILPAGQFWA
jgi:hypothetical protein